MGVIMEDAEMEMVLLNGRTDCFDGFISSIDAFGKEVKFFTFKFVKSGYKQEEQRKVKEINKIKQSLKRCSTASRNVSCNL